MEVSNELQLPCAVCKKSTLKKDYISVYETLPLSKALVNNKIYLSAPITFTPFSEIICYKCYQLVCRIDDCERQLSYAKEDFLIAIKNVNMNGAVFEPIFDGLTPETGIHISQEKSSENNSKSISSNHKFTPRNNIESFVHSTKFVKVEVSDEHDNSENMETEADLAPPNSISIPEEERQEYMKESSANISMKFEDISNNHAEMKLCPQLKNAESDINVTSNIPLQSSTKVPETLICKNEAFFCSVCGVQCDSETSLTFHQDQCCGTEDYNDTVSI